MPGFVGFPEILLLAVVALLIFGPKKLPEMGRSLGKGMREFKESISNDRGDATDTSDDGLRVLRATEAADDPFADATIDSESTVKRSAAGS